METPPALVTLDCRSTNILNITCTAVGGPVPVVSWRRNWGHIPPNCQQTCIEGVSHLVCIDFRVSWYFYCYFLFNIFFRNRTKGHTVVKRIIVKDIFSRRLIRRFCV